jgi:hypothetical protein
MVLLYYRMFKAQARIQSQEMSTTTTATTTLCFWTTHVSSFFSICLVLTKQIQIKPKHEIMKFLPTFLTTLKFGQAVAALNDNTPTRNLKGRQVVAKPETMAQKTKPLEMLRSTPLPAESLDVEGLFKQVVAKPKSRTQKTKLLNTPQTFDVVEASTGDNEVVIEVNHDDYPEETGWTLRDGAGTLITSQPIGSFLTVGGTSSETVFVAKGDYTFE